MNKPLLNDICRCFGRGCDAKSTCQRYATIFIDDKTRRYNYMDAMKEFNDNVKCKFYIEDAI